MECVQTERLELNQHLILQIKYNKIVTQNVSTLVNSPVDILTFVGILCFNGIQLPTSNMNYVCAMMIAGAHFDR